MSIVCNYSMEWGYRDLARLFGESWWSKKWGAIRGKKMHGNREIVVEWTVGVVGAQVQLTQEPNVPKPRTKYKRWKNVFAVTSIALIIGRDWPRLVQPLAQSLIGSPGTLYGTICLLYATILWIDWYSNVLDLFRGARQHTIDSYSEMLCTSSEVSYIDWYSEMSWTSSEASRYPVTPCSTLHNTCNTLI